MKKKTKLIIIVSVAVVAVLIAITAMVLFIPLQGTKRDEIWLSTQKYDPSTIATVEKKPGEPFKILQLTDLQLWMDSSDNKKALDLAKDLAAQESPDLIVLTGDNVSGLFSDFLTRDIVACFEEIGIPWAPVFGNHEAEGKATLEWQADRFEEAEHCLFSYGPANLSGAGNYAVNITENGKIVQVLFLLDSGRYIKYADGAEREDYIDYNKMAWYEWNIKNASKETYGSYDPENGKVVPSMAFFHYALQEMRTVLIDAGVINPENMEPIGEGKVPENLGFGAIRERMCPQYVNSGFFDKALELGSTKNFFFGHDHANDASVVYKGIRMTYGLKAGPSPKPWNDAVAYGGTRIVFDGDQVTVEHVVH